LALFDREARGDDLWERLSGLMVSGEAHGEVFQTTLTCPYERIGTRDVSDNQELTAGPEHAVHMTATRAPNGSAPG